MKEKTVSRIFQPVPFKLNDIFRLDEKASHHLSHVLRVTKGDSLTLFNGEGGEYQAIITQIDKKGVVVELLHYSPREVESSIELHLAQGIARGDKMDFIIQKGVELGVNVFIPLITERSQVKFDSTQERKRLTHWRSVAVSACEQSTRNHVPVIEPPRLLKDWLPMVKANKCFILIPKGEGKIALSKPKEVQEKLTILLLVGPEGGLSQQEISAVLAHGFTPLTLGPRILRTETAALASAAILQYIFGDLS